MKETKPAYVKALAVIVLMMIGTCANFSSGYAQTILKTEDNPDKAISTMINIMPVDAFIPTGKYSGMTVGFGASGAYGLTSRLGFEGAASTSYISTNNGKSTFLEGGAFLNLIKREKIKDTRVMLSYKRTRDVFTRTETVTYLEVPAKVTVAAGVRGGIYHSSTHIVTDGIKIQKGASAVNLSGIYAGLQSMNKSFIKTQLKGEKEPTPTSGLFKFYGDVMFLPVSKIEDTFLASQIKSGSLGGRVGITWVVAPYRSNEHPRYNPVMHRIVVNSELGSRPVDGVYIKFGVAWGLIYR